MDDSISFKEFFPEEFNITRIDSSPSTLKFTLESSSKQAVCPKCKCISSVLHGKRTRSNITDLPFLDRNVLLDVILKEFICSSDGIFAENPDDFLIPRKSVTRRCGEYLSSIKRLLNGNISAACIIANNAHIPVERGVIRYIPVKIDICESDKLWIHDIILKGSPDAPVWKKEELLDYILRNCEKNLHPNLTSLSLYDLKCLISLDESLKERVL